MPEIARIVVVLPAPLAPRITTISPSFTSRSMPCSTSTGPYPARQPTDLEQAHACAPEVGLDDGRVGPDVAGGPSAILRPNSIATTLSEMPMTIAMWCSTSSTVRPNSSRIVARSCRRARRPRRGSGRRPARPSAGTRGLAASARAISSRFSVPNGRPAAGRNARWPRPSRASRSPASSRIRRSSRPTPMRSDRPGEADRALAVRADHHVLEQRHRGEQGEVLERAGDAQAGDAVGRHGRAGRGRRSARWPDAGW